MQFNLLGLFYLLHAIDANIGKGTELVPCSSSQGHSAIPDKSLVKEVRVSVSFVSVGIHANHHISLIEVIFSSASLCWDADSYKWSPHAEFLCHFEAALLQRVNHRFLDIINPWLIFGQFSPRIMIFGFAWIIPHVWLSSCVQKLPVFVIVFVSWSCIEQHRLLRPLSRPPYRVQFSSLPRY